MHLVCLICTDEIKTDCSAPKCGHIFHSDCLKHWLQLNKSCPQCRAKCSKPGDVIRLFLNSPGDEGNCSHDLMNTETGAESPDRLRSRLYETEQKLSEKESDLFLLKEEFSLARESFHSLKASHGKLEKKYAEERRAVSQLSKELKSVYLQFDKTKEENIEYATRCQKLENSARVYKLIQSALDNGKSDIEFLVASYGEGPDAVRSIAQSFFHLKKNYDELKVINGNIRAEKEKCLNEKKDLELLYSEKVHKLSKAQNKIATLSSEMLDYQQNPLNTSDTEKQLMECSPSVNETVFKRYKAKRIKVSYDCNPFPSPPGSGSIPEQDLTDDSTNIVISRTALPLDLRSNFKKFSLIKHINSDTASKKLQVKMKHKIRL